MARKRDSDFIRRKLIEAGVKNLKEFGYPNVDTKNILTDYIYRKFFESMLEDNKGQGVDAEIDALLVEVRKGKTDGT